MSQMPPPPPPPGTTPPPPPPGMPPPATLEQRPFGIGDAISYGWSKYWQNVGILLAITVLIIVINAVAGGILSAIGNAFPRVHYTSGNTRYGIGVGFILAQIISLVIGAVLAMGLIRATLAVTEGQKPDVSMLFRSEGLAAYIVASILVTIGVLIGLILLIIPGIILLIMWHFYGFVIVQNPDIGATEAMRRSAEITRGHRWQLFGLGLLLFGINILGLMACCVGVLFTEGITAMAVAYAYKTLSGQPVAA
ncbi:MAG TPA: DUF975 family protein [Acidimicrobiia bacterium]|nr:DUF975 family protein [Acidimicrobiia bacterium]